MFIEKRSFYCLENGKCVTVWKTLNNICYVMPYKYYGLLKPSDSYIQTTNLADIDVFWSDDFSNEVFFAVSSDEDLKRTVNGLKNKLILSNIYCTPEEYKAKILQNNTSKRTSILKEHYRNILYSEGAKTASDVRENVSFLMINIADNRVRNKKASK